MEEKGEGGEGEGNGYWAAGGERERVQ